MKDEAVFDTRLNPSDARIIDQGRELKDTLLIMDKEIDNADGPRSAKLRWYVCSGIDCDEGWEISFLREK